GRTLAAPTVLDPLEDLFAVDRDGLRSVDADANLVPLDPENRDGDVFANHHRLANSSRQNEHVEGPPQSLFVCLLPGPPRTVAGRQRGHLTTCPTRRSRVPPLIRARTATLTPASDPGATI